MHPSRMHWSDDLDPKQHRELLRRFDTLPDAAAATIADPRYAEECERLGVKVEIPASIDRRGHRYPPLIQVPQGNEAVFQLLVVEAQLEEASPATGERDLSELNLGGGYTKDEIAAAVDLLARGQLGPRPLERGAPMSYPRAQRLSALFTRGAAGWDGKTESLTAASGFRWVKRKTPKGERLALTRVD